MSQPPERPDVRLRLELTDDDQVLIWSRDGMTQDEIVELLRAMADGFESGGARRVR